MSKNPLEIFALSHRLLLSLLIFLLSCLLLFFFLPQEASSQAEKTDNLGIARSQDFVLQGTWLNLERKQMQSKSPDLDKHLRFYGPGKRADLHEASFLFGFRSDARLFLARSKEPLYLCCRYEEGHEPHYEPCEEKSSLWLLPELRGDTLFVKLFFDGATVEGESLSFSLPISPLPKAERNSFGKTLDASFSLKQSLRSYGQDLFLQEHGGDKQKEKACLFFTKDKNVYPRYLQLGDFLIFKEGIWEYPKEGEETRKYPLLFLESFDPSRLLIFHLWESDTSEALTLRVLLTRTRNTLANIEKNLHFRSLRTWKEAVLETPQASFSVQIGDWWLHENSSWRKLDSMALVDAFVSHQLQGELLVIDQIERRGGRKSLKGHIFSRERHLRQEIDLSLDKQ